MSVIIKNMEMPTSCEDCPCAYFTEGAHHDYCQALGYDSEIKYGSEWKLDNCPLFPVPKHGDLIDRDALTLPTNLNDWNSVAKYIANITDVWKAIDNAPTIIPEEDGE